MSQARYGSSEEKVGLLQLRFANYTGAPLAGRLRAEIRLPDGRVWTLYDQSTSIIDHYDRNVEATVQVSANMNRLPRSTGTYEASCALENTATGAVEGSDVQSFEVRSL